MPDAFKPFLPLPFRSHVGERMLIRLKSSGRPSIRASPRLSFSGTLGTTPVPSP
jgi:hypothetical protein